MQVTLPLAPGQAPTYRHGRPITVADNLDRLVGPRTGLHTLPTRLNWSRSRDYDLSDSRRAQTMYETVLREASRDTDLEIHLNKDLLLDLWPHLVLPGFVRRMWESAHSELTC